MKSRRHTRTRTSVEEKQLVRGVLLLLSVAMVITALVMTGVLN